MGVGRIKMAARLGEIPAAKRWAHDHNADPPQYAHGWHRG